MRSRPSPIYRLLHRDYNESFNTYQPALADFYEPISRKLPPGWEIRRQGIWFHCCSPEKTVPRQGWKIHISATPANVHQILDRAASVLFEHGDVDFKFALDCSILFLLNSKNWPRGGSGKFLTIYPKDLGQFLDLIEALHVATLGMSGPYILSDYRYKHSGVVFYRYGGMRLHDTLTIKGERCPVLVSPNGQTVPDRRLAYPVIPSWVSSPFASTAQEQQQGESTSLKDGRYRMQDALEFSNAGGVYRALDTCTGKTVLIKEARPHVNATADGHDAVALLKKEFRLLTVVADARISPQPIDLFQQWEHWFLVEEYLEGSSMSSYSAAHNVLLRTRPKQNDYEEWYASVRSFFRQLMHIVDILHERRIVFSDLSTSNLIVCRPALDLKLIDFEGAFQLDVDRPTALYTPGFASPSRLAGLMPAREDDYYSIGATLLSYLFPVNGLFHLRPEAKASFVAAISRDANIPAAVASLVLDLMNTEADRPSSHQVCQVLDRHPSCDEPVTSPAPAIDYASLIEGIAAHTRSAAAYNRPDRLFPADPRVFVTNPLSLAYGAAGVAYALDKTTGACPSRVLDWILGHKVTPDTYAPGLYVGSSGIAWALLELGAASEAKRILRSTLQHPLLFESADFFHGLAGWGMTNLRFFAEEHDEFFLENAALAGRRLLETGLYDERGCHWPAAEGPQPIGLAHGASGAALFLLYLHMATGDQQYLDTATLALQFDLSFAVETTDAGLSWSTSAEGTSPVYPYWRYGSAGIGTVVLRFYSLLGAAEYKDILEKIYIDTDRKYAALPGKFTGLAGVGDFLMDLYDFTRERRYLKSAQKAAEGLAQYCVHRDGVAFPGECLSRLCCDYGTGSGGVALFLSRLNRRRGSDFLLDSLAKPRLSKSENETSRVLV